MRAALRVFMLPRRSALATCSIAALDVLRSAGLDANPLLSWLPANHSIPGGRFPLIGFVRYPQSDVNRLFISIKQTNRLRQHENFELTTKSLGCACSRDDRFDLQPLRSSTSFWERIKKLRLRGNLRKTLIGKYQSTKVVWIFRISSCFGKLELVPCRKG